MTPAGTETGTGTGTVGIIGGGMAGLACATELAKHGITSTIFDKGRGPGGRMATRRTNIGEMEVRFDHGAQYFSAQDAAFQKVCEAWQTEGVVAPWPAASDATGEDALVGIPGMNAPLRHMAEKLDVRWAERVEQISRIGDRWHLVADDQTHDFACVVVAAPAEQAAVLLADAAPEIAEQAASTRSNPCWAVMVLFAEPLDIARDVLRDDHAPIPWAARNGAKPGRGGLESWVIHGSPDYSREILEQTPTEICPVMLAQFFDQAGIAAVEPEYCAGHRWRFAMVPQGAGKDQGERAIWDGTKSLGVAGDWLGGAKVEGAFLSGRALAQLIAHDG